MWTHWPRPSRIGEPSTGHTNPAPNVDAHCGGPPRALTCVPFACPCHGSPMRPENGSTSCSPEPHGGMRPRPTHGANLRQGMGSGKAVRVAPFETPARPAHPKARHVRTRGQPGVQRFLCRVLYTVFVRSSTQLWFLSRLWNCQRSAQHLIDCSYGSRRYLRTVQAMQKKRLYCSIHLASACIGPRRAPINHQLGDVLCTACLYLVVSAQDSERRRPPLNLLLACAYRELVAIPRLNSAFR